MQNEVKEVTFDTETFTQLREALQLVHDRYDEVNYYLHELKADQLPDYMALLDRAEHRAGGTVIRLTYREILDLWRIAIAWAETDAFHPERDDEDEGDAETALSERIGELCDRHFGKSPSAFRNNC